jgi:hypothetical protein
VSLRENSCVPVVGHGDIVVGAVVVELVKTVSELVVDVLVAGRQVYVCVQGGLDLPMQLEPFS